MRFLSAKGVDLKIDYFNELSIMPHAHIHPEYEFYFCPEAIGQVSVINGVEYRYKHAAVILSAPYTIHSMSCDDKDATSYERYVFYFGEKTVSAFDKRLLPSELFETNVGLLYELTDSEAKELYGIVTLYRDCKSIAESELVFALFVKRLIAICPPERISKVGSPSFYIQDVLRYVSENLGSKIDVGEMSKRFAVSRSKLDRDFKRFTGMTVHSYLDMCRVNQAKYLLDSESDMPMSEIALACGFESESCFFHFFKRVTGKNTSEYRRKK
ncbi:MAG: AraC family transcriptional regulator [Clostridia bacterium]|nr:AraC family transcriptional regulator [Clostridia bacterium]